MKAPNLFRIGALMVLGATLLIWASSLAAADPSGDSPANAIPVGVTTFDTCTSFTVAPRATLWVQVPYHLGKDVEIHTKNASGVNSDVFDPQQISGFPSLPANPTGRLTPNIDELGYTNSWRGHLGTGQASGFFYVRITNTTGAPITFSLCTIENDQFFPPPMDLPGTTTTTTNAAPTFSTSSTTTTTSSFTSSSCIDCFMGPANPDGAPINR